MDSPLLWIRVDPEMEYLAEIHFHQPVQMWVRTKAFVVSVIYDFIFLPLILLSVPAKKAITPLFFSCSILKSGMLFNMLAFLFGDVLAFV